MAIDKSGRWWCGSEPSDLDEYIGEYSADSYPATRIVHASCEKDGGIEFRVRVDDEEGFIERKCSTCGTAVAMLDSAEYADDASPRSVTCPCRGKVFNVAIGFATREDGGVRWVYNGLRCVRDGTLGVWGEWKIDYEPSEHLYALV